jgi:hypothetical protein
LARLLRPPRAKAAQAIASGIVLSEAIEGKGDAMFREKEVRAEWHIGFSVSNLDL